jgi:hypothetical protein
VVKALFKRLEEQLKALAGPAGSIQKHRPSHLRLWVFLHVVGLACVCGACLIVCWTLWTALFNGYAVFVSEPNTPWLVFECVCSVVGLVYAVMLLAYFVRGKFV